MKGQKACDLAVKPLLTFCMTLPQLPQEPAVLLNLPTNAVILHI